MTCEISGSSPNVNAPNFDNNKSLETKSSLQSSVSNITEGINYHNQMVAGNNNIDKTWKSKLI